jgi:hypothetical protein
MKSYLAMILIMLTASFVLVGSTPSAQAQKVAGPNRPATVPEGYVITPFGYFHPSCVRGFESGATVLADGRVEHVDGTVDKEAPVCNYPHFTARGEIVAKGVKQPTISHSWIESGNAVNTTSSFGELTATWKVPPTPTSNDKQTMQTPKPSFSRFWVGMTDLLVLTGILPAGTAVRAGRQTTVPRWRSTRVTRFSAR